MEEANSSKGYPGWKMDLRISPEYNAKTEYPLGIHPNCMKDSWPITVREVAMMLVMDRLSDKPDWHIKVFDDAIADKWRKEALAWPEEDLWNRIDHIERWQPEEGDELDEEVEKRMNAMCPKRPKNILDQASVDYCIEELRHKAEYFKKTSIVPTLDASYMVAKSDSLVSPQLRADLKEGFDRLQADQAANPDWHPNTNETVQDLVHPSMYPLVYGRSRFFEGEVVGVADAIDKWAGKGIVIPKWFETRAQTNTNRRNIERNYWSDDYQWLPANVKLTDEGGVKFTSYINNLHPVKYMGIYRSLEQLIETALPMWDQCLTHIEHWKFVANGRTEPRIIPEDPDDSNQDHWIPKEPKARKNKQSGKGSLGNWQEAKENSPEEEELGEEDTEDEEEEEDEDDYEKREPVFPPPPPFSKSKVNYDVNPARTLRSMFKDTGLQVIVKMASIELTPEKPEFPAGGWHVEGMMNERIVGTALYYLDSENITESHLEFRTSTENYLQDDRPFDQVGQDGYQWMQSVYGAYFGGGAGQACLQHYGSVLTPQGRMLAFPNVFHHRVSGFKLADPTKPGHRRFIALWLVDPLTRIISTANVPPQQAEWWADLAFGPQAASSSSVSESKVQIPPEMVQLLLEKGLAKKQLADAVASGDVASVGRLPPELVEMVRKELPGEELPMSRKEAEEHRLELMKERSGFHECAESTWRKNEYNFCEH
ncbi:hypothetical protein QBC43DRAFT_319850 [Cladorrhinum sp. PSN259]|nr:hypothetical protein QBC43DRAFT_319850 [Cladorrhinum sp. PSN259]